MAANSVASGRPPELSSRAASALITSYFPLKDVSLDSFKPFPSYDDRNIYFTGALENGSGCNREPFVLKLYNCTCPFDVLEALNSVMLFLTEKGIPCCCPIASRGGRYAVTVSQKELLESESRETAAAVVHTVKVVKFIPGVVMDKLEKCYLTPELSYCVGSVVGRMDLALMDFKNSIIEERKFDDWDLMYFTDVKEYIPHLRDEHKRTVARSVVAMYEEHIVPAIPSMKKGVVHNDMNGLNILFTITGNKCELSGFIDFGDCIRTCYLFELAIMLAYGMLEKENPVEFVAPMLQGYRNVFPLSKEELNCLYYAVLARLCQSAVNGEYRYTQEPWNTYLLTTPTEAWKLMKLLLTLTKEGVEEIWNVAIM